MRHRFLLHSLNHTFLAVDITGCPHVKPDPRGSQLQTVPIVRFLSWIEAKRYFIALGADDETVDRASSLLGKTSVAVLTIT